MGEFAAAEVMGVFLDVAASLSADRPGLGLDQLEQGAGDLAEDGVDFEVGLGGGGDGGVEETGDEAG